MQPLSTALAAGSQHFLRAAAEVSFSQGVMQKLVSEIGTYKASHRGTHCASLRTYEILQYGRNFAQ